MKRLGCTHLGLLFLRRLYRLVALLTAGFTAVFTANVTVMQAMEIPRNYSAMAGTVLDVPMIIANVLSLPLLVLSMASLVLLCLVFAGYIWPGHSKFRLMLPEGMPRVALGWYSFVHCLGIPILVFRVAFFAKAEAKVRGKIVVLLSVSAMSCVSMSGKFVLSLRRISCFFPTSGNRRLSVVLLHAPR